MWLWAMVSTAWPCAGLSHAEGVLAESDAAEVIFEVEQDAVTVSYAVRYEGDASNFGWVIPIPAAPSAVEDGDIAQFNRYHEGTQPSIERPPDDSTLRGGGCSCVGAATKGGDSSEQNDLDIVAEGFTGTYEWVAITSTDVAALQTWFSDNGWTGLATEDIDHYVSDGAVFVALTIVPDSAKTPEGGRQLPPIRISYPGAEIVFPSVMARHASVQTQRTTVFVSGASRAMLTGWGSEDGTALHGSKDGDPNEIWDEHIGALGEDQRFLRTWAGAFDDAFLTRFDTLAPSGVHTEDAVFSLQESSEPLSTSIVLDESESESAALLVLPFAALGLLRRRRR